MSILTPKGDRTVNKKILLGMIACVLLLTVGLLTACDGGNSPADTTAEDTPAPTDVPTEEPTPEATEPADTEAPTQPEETTEEVTTEPETDDGIPLNELTIGGVDIKNYTLVVQDGGAACVRDSADELIDYIEQATAGFRIPEEAFSMYSISSFAESRTQSAPPSCTTRV